MVAVSNTTPLRYLIAIRQEHLLEKLFHTIVIPDAVLAELTHVGTPEPVRRIVSSSPPWLKIRSVRLADVPISWPRLHQGEREAIALAEELAADVLLIDERHGRNAALARKLRLSGTLGVLEVADSLGLVEDFPEGLNKLKTAGFFLKPALEAALLLRHKERRSQA